jgi:4-amino-4-deoxy-L-arabinose transferase-like glycosyltransferase
MKTFERKNGKIFGIETTFVLFFLAIEFGRTSDFFTVDSLLLAAALLMLIVLPYLLSADENGFGKWILGRSLITGFAFAIGAMFKQSLGIALPESFRFLPMTLLILAAMIGCYIQFYSFFKLRPTK